MAILSFADKLTENFFETGEIPSKRVGWIRIKKIAKRKLDRLHFAKGLQDLSSTPGNRLKKLTNTNLYSIRINEQWRMTFKWTAQGPTCVKITDYHT